MKRKSWESNWLSSTVPAFEIPASVSFEAYFNWLPVEMVEMHFLKQFFLWKKSSFMKIEMLHRNVAPPSFQLIFFFVLVRHACSDKLASCFNFCITLLEFKTGCFDSSKWISLKSLLHSEQATKPILRPEAVLCRWVDKSCPLLGPSVHGPSLDGQHISIGVFERMLLPLGIWP